MNRKIWQQWELDYLTLRYPETTADIICVSLDRQLTSVYQKAAQLGLEKSEAFKQSELSGRLTKVFNKGAVYRYGKGHVPVNKGKKWEEFMSEEGRKASMTTTFKKGQLPHNTKADGVITIRPDNKGNRYKWIRVALGKWKMLHVKVWEDANGTLPKGMIVVFRDRDRMNCELQNLEMISRAENMKRNSYHRYPKEIANTIQLMGALKRKINKKIKLLKDEK